MNATLEQRLEEWAIWVQGGAVPINLGDSSVAPGFGDGVSGGGDYLVMMSRQEEVEAAVMRLQVLGHGLCDSDPPQVDQ